MSVLHWVKQHDPGLSALRRAGRTAIVMPALFAVGDKVIGNPIIGTFAAFGTFALLLLVDFPGPTRDRLSAQAALCATGAVLVCLGTLAGRASWLAAMAMAVVAFLVLFSAVISSVRAGSTTALLLSFILPVTFHGPLSSLPDRLAGWGMASAGSLLAVSLLWPAPARYPLRSSAAAACRALADRLRADVAYILSGETLLSDGEHDEIVERASEAAQALQRTFLATPYRPTGLGTAARTVVRLVDEIRWLNAIIARIDPRPTGPSASPIACPVRMAAAAVLECCADLLGSLRASADPLRHALGELRTALVEMEEKATLELPIGQFVVSGPPEIDWRVEEFVTALDPTFRSQELTFGTAQVGGNVLLASQAERRSWLDRLLGRQPEGLSRTFAAATERVASHLERHSVSLHNSLRGAVALGVAVLIANLTGVAHSFWVVLGTLAVLRSNALSTGQNIVRGILGTVVGFVIGGALVALIGTNSTALWILLPVAIVIAGFAPAAISFAAGQAAFTVVLVILYNIIQPAGWRIGLVRIEDVAIGCVVSLGVGILFWPRGAGVALRDALSDAYQESAHYLASAVDFGMGQCDRGVPRRPAPTAEAVRAASASRRLDDAFRGYLAEQGRKVVSLAEVTSLVTGPAALRLAGDAVLDLWQRQRADEGDRAGARQQILTSSGFIVRWYDAFAASLSERSEVPAPLERDPSADGRILEALGRDLRGDDGKATSTAIRMIWTSDHLDAARRLQATIVGPAVAAAQSNPIIATRLRPPAGSQVASQAGASAASSGSSASSGQGTA